MEKLRGHLQKRMDSGKWYIVPQLENGLWEHDVKIPLSEFDLKFAGLVEARFRNLIHVEYEIHQISGVSVAKIMHPDDILDRIGYSLQDMLDMAKYGFDYQSNSTHNGFVPEGNIKQHLFAKFGIV